MSTCSFVLKTNVRAGNSPCVVAPCSGQYHCDLHSGSVLVFHVTILLARWCKGFIIQLGLRNLGTVFSYYFLKTNLYTPQDTNATLKIPIFVIFQRKIFVIILTRVTSTDLSPLWEKIRRNSDYNTLFLFFILNTNMNLTVTRWVTQPQFRVARVKKRKNGGTCAVRAS